MWDEYTGSYGEIAKSIFGLSGNKKITWTVPLIEEFIDYLDWDTLSKRNDLLWSIDLVKKFQNKWNWKNLGENKNLPWSKEFIREFENNWNLDWIDDSYDYDHDENKWNWNLGFRKTILDNPVILRNPELLFSINNGQINWRLVGGNEKCPPPIEMIRKIKDFIKGKYWESNAQYNYSDSSKNWWLEEFFIGLSNNKAVNWTDSLIEEFKNYWSWGNIEVNIPDENTLPEGYVTIRYKGLTGNEAITWTVERIEQYKDYIDWKMLSQREDLQWSKELINNYTELWHWELLRKNDNFLIYNKDKSNHQSKYSIDWENLSSNEKANSPIELLRKNVTEIDGEELFSSYNWNDNSQFLNISLNQFVKLKSIINPTEEFYTIYEGLGKTIHEGLNTEIIIKLMEKIDKELDEHQRWYLGLPEIWKRIFEINLLIQEDFFFDDLHLHLSLKNLISINEIDYNYRRIPQERLSKLDLLKAVSLKNIYCNGESIDDINPLSHLKQIRNVSLFKCEKIRTLLPLENAIGLERIDISYTSVNTLIDLENLPILKEIHCWHTLIPAEKTNLFKNKNCSIIKASS